MVLNPTLMVLHKGSLQNISDPQFLAWCLAQNSVGAQDRPPQDVPQRHVYFELKLLGKRIQGHSDRPLPPFPWKQETNLPYEKHPACIKK